MLYSSRKRQVWKTGRSQLDRIPVKDISPSVTENNNKKIKPDNVKINQNLEI